MRIAILCALSLVLLAGCPKEKRALNAARKAVEIAAQTVDLVDSEVASLYAEAGTTALAACEDRTCYDSAMRRWDKTVRGVVAMKGSLLLVETSLDAWEAGSPNGRANLLSAAACFLEGLLQLQGLLDGLGVNAPALDHGLEYTEGLFGLNSVACTGVL